MKILSIAIPCYNSAAYMRHAVETLLVGGEDVEILIVDDGSKDDTYSIGCELQKQYPSIIKCIHKENGGHGSAVNTGLANATGVFFKVVDSDDSVNETSFLKALGVLRDTVTNGKELDLLYCNYVYDKVIDGTQKVISYRNVFPTDRYFTWDEVGHFKVGQYILMHSVIYRTDLLKECGLKLPEHCFYVDNVYVYYPLPYVKNMYYLDENLYMYFIGREDQSVNEENMKARIDQQLLVTRTMIDMYDLTTISNKKLRSYMLRYLGIMMSISSVFLIKIGNKEALAKKDDIWKYLKTKNSTMYRQISRSIVCGSGRAQTAVGRGIVKAGYKLGNILFKFN